MFDFLDDMAKGIGKKLVEKFCKHQGFGNYSVDETKLIKAINKVIEKHDKKVRLRHKTMRQKKYVNTMSRVVGSYCC